MTQGPSLPMSSQLLHDDPTIDSLTLAVNYHCNSRCRFCIIEKEIEDQLPDTDDDVLRRVLELNRDTQQFKRLTLTGAEVTLLDDLEGAARPTPREPPIAGSARGHDPLRGRRRLRPHHARGPARDGRLVRALTTRPHLEAGTRNGLADLRHPIAHEGEIGHEDPQNADALLSRAHRPWSRQYLVSGGMTPLVNMKQP